ncbi:MAG TPA: hypothetical protein VLY23_17275 [Candidatus Acidoferrum sp.]|nr:hypothetical protein [Candidatus Acidoferrum sp.]
MSAMQQSAASARSVTSPGTPLRLLRSILSFPVLLGVLLATGAFFANPLQKTGDTLFSEGDTWWHIRAGDEIVRTHKFPHTETYSWTAAGTHWIAYEWLGDVVMAEAYRVGHLRGLRLLQWALAATMLALLYTYATMRCQNLKAAFATCAAVVPVVAGFWSLRPQLFGYIFFVIVLILLEWFRRGRTCALWLLPLVFVVWANTHGTFVFGVLAIGIVWICGIPRYRFSVIESFEWNQSQRVQLAVAALASVLGLLVTPYGSQLAAYPFDIGLLQPANVANIQEWMPITSERFLTLAVLILLLSFMMSKVLLRFPCRLDDLALLSFAALTTFLHLRFVPLFLIVTVPLLALPLTRWFSPYDRARDRVTLNAVLIVILGLGIVWYFPSNGELETACAAHYPTAAIQHLKADRRVGNIFNDYGWGGYLAWSHFPARGVFIDGRADVFEHSGVFDDYLSVARLEPNAFKVLEKYHIETCLVRSNSPVATVLAEMPGWQLVYSDEVSAVFARRDAAPPLSQAVVPASN